MAKKKATRRPAGGRTTPEPAAGKRLKAARRSPAAGKAAGARKRTAGGPPLKDEPLADKKERAARIVALLSRAYPNATTALHWSNPLQLLIATILSAQCTDERVNMVTPALFSKYRTARDYVAGPPAEIERMIQSAGFFRQKTRSIQGACQLIDERYGGQVPRTMDEMLALPGVARKTANVVLGTAYGMSEGIVVDTHVGRVSWRLGLTPGARDTKDAVRIEQDLITLVPRERWTQFAHALVWHGRGVCTARKPRCGDCVLAEHCPSAFTFDNAAGTAGGDGTSGG